MSRKSERLRPPPDGVAPVIQIVRCVAPDCRKRIRLERGEVAVHAEQQQHRPMHGSCFARWSAIQRGGRPA